MNYQENSLTYEEYCSLRESVGWKNFPKIQIQEILKEVYIQLWPIRIIKQLEWED